MSDYRDMKSDFHRDLLKGLPVVSGYETVPEHIRARWQRRYFEVPGWLPRLPQRLLNHFMVGADPEFMLLDAAGATVESHTLGLQQAQAFGCDNSGRQVEIRPTPSRSTLDVVASIASTLRWMALLKPKTRPYHWRSGGFVNGDGLGGHIHFGRKRPNAEREHAALDTLTFRLFHIGVFNMEEGRQRQGDRHIRNGYGRPSDVRPQRHGYEYRTLPSWLDSPYMAFMVLTLAKLAVLNPSLWPAMAEGDDGISVETVKSQLRAILAHFKPLDDDAALAFGLLERWGWPEATTTDFRKVWGVPTVAPSSTETRNFTGMYIPGSIEPREYERAGVLNALWNRTPISMGASLSNWTPTGLPKGYRSLIDVVSTRHVPGLGELTFDLCYNETVTPFGCALSNGREYTISATPDLLKSNWREIAKERKFEVQIHLDDRHKNQLYLESTHLRDNERRSYIKSILADSGIFPIFRVSEVQVDSADKWLKAKSSEGVVAAQEVARPKKSNCVRLGGG